MTTEKQSVNTDDLQPAIVKEPSKRTPRSADAITAGALSLPLQERVDMVKVLQESITEEVRSVVEAANKAKEIAGVK